MRRLARLLSLVVVLMQVQTVLAVTPQEYVVEHGDPSSFNQTELHEFLMTRAATTLPKPDIETPDAAARRLFGSALSPTLIRNLGLDHYSMEPRASTGRNTLDFAGFFTADLVLARYNHCDYWKVVPCYFSHATTFDQGYYEGNESDRALWSAYPTGAAPSDDDAADDSIDGQLGRQSIASVHRYAQAAGVYVKVTDADTWDEVVQYAYDNRGEDYQVFSAKNNSDKWYCSKLPYLGYLEAEGMDIDSDGGYWVMPDDIFLDEEVELFAVSGSIE